MFAAHNMMLARSLMPVSFDSIGAGAQSQQAPGSNWTWSQTIASDAKAALVWASTATSATTGTSTAKVGSTSMTQLASVLAFNDAGSGTWISGYLFGLLNPPTGAQTITFSNNGGVASSGAVQVAANSISYKGVSSFETPTAASGTGTSCVLAVPSSASREMVAACFFESVNFANFSAFSPTSRYNVNMASNSNYGEVFGDAAGATSGNFTAALSGSSPWRGMAVVLT